jgi:hypothetical protein
MMRSDYCESEEKEWECPVCHKILLVGPGMTQEEKRSRARKRKPCYRNKWKHFVNHYNTEFKDQCKTPPTWKDWDQEKQVDWIIMKAKEYCELKEVEY